MRKNMRMVAVSLLAGGALLASGSIFFQVESLPDPQWYIAVQNQMDDQRDGVAFTNETVTVRSLVKNTGDTPQSCTFHVEVETDDGQLEQYQWDVEKNPTQSFAYTVTIPTDRFGFTEVRAYCTDIGGTAVRAKSSCGIAVVHQPRNYDAFDDQSFCGATYVNESEAGRRLGIKYNRIYVKWDRHEPVQGQFDWSYIDSFVEAHTNAFIYPLPTIRVESVPDWVIPWDTAGDNIAFLSAWSNFVWQVGLRYGDSAGAYMIGAEPGRSLGQSFGGWLETGGACYGEMLKVATGALEQADPDTPVIAFATTRLTQEHKDIFIRSAHSVHSGGYEYISHHAYPEAKRIGDPLEGNPLMTQLDDGNYPNHFGVQTVRDARIPWQYEKVQHLSTEFGGGVTNLWPTEIGYWVTTDASLVGPELFMHAALCAQVYCVARTVPGVEKLMWYNMRYGGEATLGFGLLRGDSARPAACAIATYNDLLHHAESGRFICDRDELAIIRYEKPDDAETVFALFRYNGLDSFSTSLPAGSEVWNSFGRMVSSGSISVNLGTLPVYIAVDAADADSAEAALAAAGGAVSETVLLEEGFESGLGHFLSGGNDCLLYGGDAFAWDGTNALEIRGAAGSASTATLTDAIDLSGYTNATISFWYTGISIEDGESFSVEYFDGSAWAPLQTLAFGTERFSDISFYNESLEIDAASYSFSDNFRIRFTAGGSAADDRVLIDKICVRGVADPQVMGNESVVFCSDLQPRSAQLLFAPLEIQTVKRANGTQTFEENVDYTVDAGGLISLTPDSTIPVLDYYGMERDDTFYRFTDINGKIYYSPGGVWKHNAYDVVVTYTHTNSLAPLMEDVWASKLTVALNKLHAQIPLNVTFHGDSITVGAQASSLGMAAEPFGLSYPLQVVADLKTRFGYDQISYANKAVGGKMSSWGLETIQQVVDTDPDLVVLAFGMNDSSQSVPTADYKQNTKDMINALRAANPNVSIILVAEFSPNPEFANANYALRAQARDALYDLYSEYENIAFVDVGAVSRQIAARKKFQDFSGNNINHPNDFMHQIYADVIENVFGVDPAAVSPFVTKVTDNCTTVLGGHPTISFEGSEHAGVRGALASSDAQYALMEFELPSREITDATLRLKTFSDCRPAAWGDFDVNIQVMVMSSNNVFFDESSATFLEQSAGQAWLNSSGGAANTLFAARDLGVTGTLSTYLAPAGGWQNDTVHNIELHARTVNALEALRAAGQTHALLYIQVKNDDLDNDGSGVRFYSDDSAHAPQLVLELSVE